MLECKCGFCLYVALTSPYPLNTFYTTFLMRPELTHVAHMILKCPLRFSPRFISFQDHNCSCLFLREIFNNSTFLAAQQMVFQHKPKSVLSALHYLLLLHLPMPASYLTEELQRCSNSLLHPHL